MILSLMLQKLKQTMIPYHLFFLNYDLIYNNSKMTPIKGTYPFSVVDFLFMDRS